MRQQDGEYHDYRKNIEKSPRPTACFDDGGCARYAKRRIQ